MALVAELEFLRGLVLHCVGHVIAAAAVVVVMVVVLVVVAVAGFPLVPLVGLDLDAVNRWFSFASFAQSTPQQHCGMPQRWHSPFVFFFLSSCPRTSLHFWM